MGLMLTSSLMYANELSTKKNVVSLQAIASTLYYEVGKSKIGQVCKSELKSHGVVGFLVELGVLDSGLKVESQYLVEVLSQSQK